MKSLPLISVLFFSCFGGCGGQPSVEEKVVGKKAVVETSEKLPLTGATKEQTKPRSVSVLVFRHHPGIIMPEGQMQGKIDDKKLIMRTMKERNLPIDYSGGLGSGFDLMLDREYLDEWMEMIQSLIKHKQLKYYTKFDFDEHGFGLTPIQ